MARLIDADALKDRWTIASTEPINTDAVEVLGSIDKALTLDAVPAERCISYRILVLCERRTKGL